MAQKAVSRMMQRKRSRTGPIWQLTRFVMSSYRSGDEAPTMLGTPLWIPQAFMPLGILAATISLTRSMLGNWRRFRAGGV